MGREVASYSYLLYDIDVCSLHIDPGPSTPHSLDAFHHEHYHHRGMKTIVDYRLSERHYGSLQGYVKNGSGRRQQRMDTILKISGLGGEAGTLLIHFSKTTTHTDLKKSRNILDSVEVQKTFLARRESRNGSQESSPSFLNEVLMPSLDEVV